MKVDRARVGCIHSGDHNVLAHCGSQRNKRLEQGSARRPSPGGPGAHARCARPYGDSPATHENHRRRQTQQRFRPRARPARGNLVLVALPTRTAAPRCKQDHPYRQLSRSRSRHYRSPECRKGQRRRLGEFSGLADCSAAPSSTTLSKHLVSHTTQLAVQGSFQLQYEFEAAENHLFKTRREATFAGSAKAAREAIRGRWRRRKTQFQ